MVPKINPLKPVERRLVRATEEVLGKRFESAPLYAFANSDGISKIRNGVLEYYLGDGASRDFDKNSNMGILETLDVVSGGIFLNQDSLSMFTNKLANRVSASQLYDCILLHSLGHVYLKDLGSSSVRKKIQARISDFAKYTASRNKGLISALLDKELRSNYFKAKQVDDLNRGFHAAEESFCNYLMMEASKKISDEKHLLANGLNLSLTMDNTQYSYAKFFYKISDMGLKPHCPFVGMPSKLPDTFYLKHPLLYVSDYRKGNLDSRQVLSELR